MKNLILIFIFVATFRGMTLEEAFRANNLFTYQMRNESVVAPPEQISPKEQLKPSKEIEQGLEETKRINFLEDNLRTIEKDTASSYESMNKKLETLTSQISKLTEKIESLEKTQASRTVQPAVQAPAEQTYRTVATNSQERTSLEKPEIKTAFSEVPKANEKSNFAVPTSFSSNSNQMARDNAYSFNQPMPQQQGFGTPDMSQQYAIGSSPYNTNQAYNPNSFQTPQYSSLQSQVPGYSSTPSLRGAANSYSNNYQQNTPYFNPYPSSYSPETSGYKTVSSYSGASNSNSKNYFNDDSGAVEAETMGF